MSASDFFRKLQPLFADDATRNNSTVVTEAADLAKAGQKAIKNMKKNTAEKKAAEEKAEKEKKAKDVKEGSARFFRAFADIISEAEAQDEEVIDESYGDDEDEDPDVTKADKVKGKDGTKQADFDKGKKWNFEKSDKKDEDNGAKKAKKEI